MQGMVRSFQEQKKLFFGAGVCTDVGVCTVSELVHVLVSICGRQYVHGHIYVPGMKEYEPGEFVYVQPA